MRIGNAFGISLLETVLVVLNVISTFIFIWVILSWVMLFLSQSSFRWKYRGAYATLSIVNDFLTRAAHPMLRPFRRLLPPHKTAGIDWSPLLLLLLIFFLQRFLVLAFA